MQSIKNVGLEIGDIAADYQVGTHNGVLFLRLACEPQPTSKLTNSLKYHRLHPEYIHQRIEKMRNMYRVRILLVLCDVVSEQGGAKCAERALFDGRTSIRSPYARSRRSPSSTT